MSEYTITLHTFAGLAPNTIRTICIGLGFLFLFIIVITAEIGAYRAYYARRCLAVIGVNLVLMVAAFSTAFALPAHLYGEDVAELEQAAGVSGITGWTGDTGTTDITYTQDGKVSKGQILVSGDHATLRVTNHTLVRDKVADGA